MEEVLNYSSIVATRTWQIILWIIALPLNIFTSFVTWLRIKRYDPEKIVMPCCGFKGDDRANGATCWIKFKRIEGAQRGVIQHTCFRCGCSEVYTKLAYPGDKWLSLEALTRDEKIREVAKRAVL